MEEEEAIFKTCCLGLVPAARSKEEMKRIIKMPGLGLGMRGGQWVLCVCVCVCVWIGKCVSGVSCCGGWMSIFFLCVF